MFQLANAVLHLLIFPLQVFYVASRGCTTRDAVGRSTFRLILQARRAAAGQTIAADLPHLFLHALIFHLTSPLSRRVLRRWRSVWDAYLASIAGLTRSRGGLQSFLDVVRE